jgi:peptidoglycan biosynthesis protein MviN/MurJ (putative lipid II flippase)
MVRVRLSWHMAASRNAQALGTSRARLVLAAVFAQAVVRVGGLLRDFLIARWVGLGPVLDPYLLAFTVQGIVAGFVTSIVFVAFVQGFTRRQIELSRSGLYRALGAAAVFVMAGIAWALTFDGGARAAGLLFALAPAFGSSVLAARLIADGRQLAAVAPGTVLAVLPLAVAAMQRSSLGLDQLVLASLLAYLAEMLLLGCLVAPRLVGGRWSLGGAMDRKILVGLAGSSTFSTAWFAVDLVVVRALGASAVSLFALASRIPMGIAGVLIAAMNNVILPAASGSVEDVASFAASWGIIKRRAWQVFLLGSLITLAVIAGSLALDDAVFAGSSVTAEDARLLFATQSLLSIMLPTYLGGVLLSRYVQSSGEYATVVRAGGIALAINVTADLALAPVIGIRGVAVATALAYTSSFAYLMAAGRRLAKGHA